MRHIFPGAFPPPPPEPSMPAGLVELMEGLSRDVITHNPDDIFKFCAEHMHRLLQIRNERQFKNSMTLEKKIAIAQTKVRDRACQRCDRFDRENNSDVNNYSSHASSAQEKTDVGVDKNIVNEVNNEHDTEENIKQIVIQAANVLTTSLGSIVNKSQEEHIENDNSEVIPVVENHTTIEEDKEEYVTEDAEIQFEPVEATIDIAMKSQNDLDLNIEDINQDRLESEIINDSENNITHSPEMVPENDFDNSTVEEREALPEVKPENDSNDFIDNANTEESALQNSNTGNSEHSESNNENVEEKLKTKFDEKSELYFDTEVSVAYLKSNENISPDNNKNTEVQIPAQGEEKTNFDFVYNEKNTLECASPEILTELNNGESEFISVGDKHTALLNNDQEIVVTATQENDEIGEIHNVLSFEDTADQTNAPEKYNNNETSGPSAEISATQSENVELNSESNPKESFIDVAQTKNGLIDSDSSDANLLNTTLLETVGRTDTNEDEPNVDSVKSTVDDSETNSKEWSKQYKVDSAIDKPNSSNSALTDIPTETIYEESSYSEVTNNTEDKIDNVSLNADMDLETAAVTIQKVFRSFLINRASTLDDVSNEESLDAPYLPDKITSDEDRDSHNKKENDFQISTINKDWRGMGITRMDTVLQTVNEEKSLSLSDDSSTLSSAATVIQAHVRGFLVRNRMLSHKTTSSSSIVNSNCLSGSVDGENEQGKSKTVLNIHIVPGGGHYMSRDESMAMSVDLPLDGSPPTSASLRHSLGYDITERRKLLKREDAVQSTSPPSNNSDLSSNENYVKASNETVEKIDHIVKDNDTMSGETTPTKSTTVESVVEVLTVADLNSPTEKEYRMSSDELDVVTPLAASKERAASPPARLLHSGECHDLVLPLPTSVSRSDSPVVREFKNVLGYFLIWNKSS